MSPNKRPSLEEILAHPWLQMAMPSQEEITTEFEKRKALLDAEAKKDRADKKDQQARDAQERVVRRAGAGDYADDGGQAAAQQPREHPWEQLEVQEYGPLYQQSFTQFFTTAQPLDVFEHLHEKLNASSTEVSISGSKLKLHFLAEISSDAGESTQARVSVELLSVSDRKHCVKFTYLDPEKKTELSAKFRNGATSHFISYSTDVLKSFNDTTFDEQH